MKTLSAKELYQQGERYLKGDGVKADKKKAAECFEQAISLGNILEAKRELGYILLGNGLLQTDASDLDGLSAELERQKRGEQLLEEAAAEGDISAKKWFIKKHNHYLFAYFIGCFPNISLYLEEKKKCKIAKKYKEELIELGDLDTLYDKALSSFSPDKKLILELAEQGYAPAEYTMGMWYLKGMNYEKDLTKAKQWLSCSSEHGNEEAKKVLASLS